MEEGKTGSNPLRKGSKEEVKDCCSDGIAGIRNLNRIEGCKKVDKEMK